jgi:hypothetical protein
MRFKLAAIVMIAALPAVVAGQSPPHAPGRFPALPPIGLPLPPLGLPLSPIASPRPIVAQPPTTINRPSQRLQDDPRRFGGRRGFRTASTVFYVVPAYGWEYPSAAPAAAAAAAPAVDRSAIPQEVSVSTGTLRLEVEPARILQLYVDGYFAGTPDDFAGALTLAAGPHTIEIRAAGYQTVHLDVRIAPGSSITYRGALTPSDGAATAGPKAPATSAPPAAPQTIYHIPGCYLGNIPPKDAGLPATCDQSRVTTLKP